MGLIIVLGKECPFDALSLGSIQSKYSINGSDFTAFSIKCSCVPCAATCEDHSKPNSHYTSPPQASHLVRKGAIITSRGSADGVGCWLKPLLSCVTWANHLICDVARKLPDIQGGFENQGETAWGVFDRLESSVVAEWGSSSEGCVLVCLTLLGPGPKCNQEWTSRSSVRPGSGFPGLSGYDWMALCGPSY